MTPTLVSRSSVFLPVTRVVGSRRDHPLTAPIGEPAGQMPLDDQRKTRIGSVMMVAAAVSPPQFISSNETKL